jgi:predicted Zn-dependent protease
LSNLVITPGKHLAEELEADLEHGIVVTRIGGATVDPVSSRTVLRVERGWEVRHGRRRRSLAPCELTGNVMEILARIDPRIGADPTTDWRLGWCVKDGMPLPTGSEAPSLLVESLEVL